jgi:hypothetical protein
MGRSEKKVNFQGFMGYINSIPTEGQILCR